MKKATVATFPRADVNASTHHCAMLLAAIDGAMGEYDFAELSRYQATARQILQSSRAFDGGDETLSVADCVLTVERIGNRGGLPGEKDVNKLLRTVLEGHEHDDVTGKIRDMRGFLFATVSESTLLGAAIMYELLRGMR